MVTIKRSVTMIDHSHFQEIVGRGLWKAGCDGHEALPLLPVK